MASSALQSLAGLSLVTNYSSPTCQGSGGHREEEVESHLSEPCLLPVPLPVGSLVTQDRHQLGNRMGFTPGISGTEQDKQLQVSPETWSCHGCVGPGLAHGLGFHLLQHLAVSRDKPDRNSQSWAGQKAPCTDPFPVLGRTKGSLH